MSSWAWSSVLRLSLGGAYARVWRPADGQLWEMPMVTVQDQASGQVVRWGEAAAAMVGRTPPGWQVIRPWWGEEIIDRHILRETIMSVLAQTGAEQPWWSRAITIPLSQIAVVASPTFSPLARRWLGRTLREAGVWRWSLVDPYWALLSRPKNTASQVVVGAVLDIGFSAVRAMVYVDGQVVWAQRTPDLALCQFCHDLCQREQRVHRRRLAPSVFYDQQWFTQHVGYDEQKKAPIQTALTETIFNAQYDEWQQQLGQWLSAGIATISPDIQAQIARHGWLVVGGGATLPDLGVKLTQQLQMPTKIHTDPRYAHIRFIA